MPVVGFELKQGRDRGVRTLDGEVVTGAGRGNGYTIAMPFGKEGGQDSCALRILHQGDHQFAGSLEPTVPETNNLEARRR